MATKVEVTKKTQQRWVDDSNVEQYKADGWEVVKPKKGVKTKMSQSTMMEREVEVRTEVPVEGKKKDK